MNTVAVAVGFAAGGVDLSPGRRVGALVLRIDDTIVVTWLPRMMLAAWNSFVVRTNTRTKVPGMAEFYAEILRDHPNAPVFYLSTGAWNTLPAMQEFIHGTGLPIGPLLMTDWGPTPTGLFRSGALDQNDTYKFKFDKPGVYKIFCGIHPNMKATITVQ